MGFGAQEADLIKLDIINEVVNRTGITKTKAEMAVETVFESMKRALGRGERIELRLPDGACNPYLATAAVIAAGLDGVNRELSPGAPANRRDPAWLVVFSVRRFWRTGVRHRRPG